MRLRKRRQSATDRGLEVVEAYYAYPIVAVLKVVGALVVWCIGGQIILGVIELLRWALGV